MVFSERQAMQRPAQFPCHAGPAQGREGVSAQHRVDQGIGDGQRVRRRMVVSNDQAQAKLFGEGSLTDRGDAAVHSQQKLRLSRQPAHSLLIDAISLRVAVRNINNCFQACRLQRFPGNHAGTDAIHVIIAVNNRPGAPRAQLSDQGYGFPHA